MPRLPRDCTFSPSDWSALAQFWHPVAFSTEVEDAPHTRRLRLDHVPANARRTRAEQELHQVAEIFTPHERRFGELRRLIDAINSSTHAQPSA